MYIVNVNGKDYESAHDKKLLRFLRDDLRLTAAKDGCSEGACGTCTVLVDGQKVKACVTSLSKLAGKKVLTVEGIDPEEMKVYEHCFAEAGAVRLLYSGHDSFCQEPAGCESEPHPRRREEGDPGQPLPLHRL